MFQLRPYQQAAAQAAIDWIKKCIEPCCMELATGSGKSLIVAHIAQWLNQNTGKRVLCLQPSKELTEQNHAKYLAYDKPASIFSASISKSLRHPVVFGTPQTVKNSLSRFATGDYSLVIIDECHGITKTILTILGALREANPNLRVIGLSATPYRMNTGYIYAYEPDGTPVPEEMAVDPFFNTCVYKVTAPDLIEQGFLTPAHADPDHVASYDTSGLKLNRQGKFDAADVDRAFVGHGRKTSGIVADIVEHAKGRNGVMIFAATVQHAYEIMASLPPELSAIVTGDTDKDRRANLISRFKRMELKYLVNVSVLTTGFDAPHVDLVAIMRKTESASLLQQIIGRGLRLSPETNKTDCLVLDYAENIEFHELQDNLFEPKIKTRRKKGESEESEFICPACSTVNVFTLRPNPDEFNITPDGYFADLAGEPVENGEGVLIPAHYGRRCFGQLPVGGGKLERCSYRWSVKICPECEHENDIAARFCESCKHEIIDPNEKLREEFQRVKADPYSVTTDPVRSFRAQKWISKQGNKTLKCDYVTDYASFSVWYSTKMRKTWDDLCMACYGQYITDPDEFINRLAESEIPKTITAYKDKTSKFYRVITHNRPADEIPD